MAGFRMHPTHTDRLLAAGKGRHGCRYRVSGEACSARIVTFWCIKPKNSKRALVLGFCEKHDRILVQQEGHSATLSQ